MKKEGFAKTWEYITYGLTAYTIYKQLQTLREAKEDVYSSLAPEVKARWDKIFGKGPAVQNPIPQVPVIDPLKVEAKAIEQIKAGT